MILCREAERLSLPMYMAQPASHIEGWGLGSHRLSSQYWYCLALCVLTYISLSSVESGNKQQPTGMWGSEYLHQLHWKVQEKCKVFCALQQPHLFTSSSLERTGLALPNFLHSYVSSIPCSTLAVLHYIFFHFICLLCVTSSSMHRLQTHPQPARRQCSIPLPCPMHSSLAVRLTCRNFGEYLAFHCLNTSWSCMADAQQTGSVLSSAGAAGSATLITQLPTLRSPKARGRWRTPWASN